MFGIDDAALAIGGSAIVSGLLGSEASKDAAGATRDAANVAAGIQRDASNTMRRDLSGYRSAGASALQRLSRLTGVAYTPSRADTFNGEAYLSANPDVAANPVYGADPYRHYLEHGAAEGRKAIFASADSGASAGDEFGSLMKDFSLSDFAKDPGYQFRIDEGEKALTRGAAARGLAQSTPGLKSLMRFNQDMAGTEYGAAFARDQVNKGNKFNFLSTIAGMGQNAATQTGVAGVNTAGGVASAALAGGAATGAGILGSASAINNSVQGGMANYMTMQRYNEMMKRMPVFGTPTTPTPGPMPGGYPG